LIATLKSDRDPAKKALARITIHPKLDVFNAETIERFGQIMRQNITTGPIPFRKAYIKSVADRIQFDDAGGRRTDLIILGAPLAFTHKSG
jgi:site-specific DNA recombinase